MEGFNFTQLKYFGNDVRISDNVIIKRPNLFGVGSHIAIDSYFYCTTAAELEDYIHIGPFVSVIGGAKTKLIMGNFTTISAGARLICASDEFLGAGLASVTIPNEYRDNVISAPIVLEDFASIATNSVVLPGVTLAQGSVLGACSYLTKDTEPWTIYAGIPAKPIKIRRHFNMIEYAKRLGYEVERKNV